jgi:hypothetical protein
MAEKKKVWPGSKADEKADKKLEKGMTPKQKKEFEAKDKKMDKNKKMSKSEDMKKDKALARKITGK